MDVKIIFLLLKYCLGYQTAEMSIEFLLLFLELQATISKII